MDIKSKNVLVTGGAVRIGADICRAFADAGAHVVIHCNKSDHEAMVLLEQLGGTSVGHSIYQSDFSDTELVGEIIPEIGQIDILINNAAIFSMHPMADEDFDTGQFQFDVNYWSAVELMRTFYAQDLEEGVIINILDQRINKIDELGASYPISKKALHEATLQAALQWGPKIRVNAVAPGPVLPAINFPGNKPAEKIVTRKDHEIAKISDLTDACLFLARTDSVTGNVIYVDCGLHLT